MAHRALKALEGTYCAQGLEGPKRHFGPWAHMALKELKGTWTATNADGSYRTKTISPYLEKIKYFNSSGNLNRSQKKPMSIEIKNDLKFFTAHMPNSTYTSIFEIYDNKWYEQSRSILNSQDGLPNKFFVYERSDQPTN